MSKTSRRSPCCEHERSFAQIKEQGMERTTIKYGAALGALVLASGASAQTAPPAGALAAANPGQEEIVVLGNRRATQALESRSEERRVGKECVDLWSSDSQRREMDG